MIALSWWWGKLSPWKFEGVALDFGSVDLDFGFDVGHVPPKVSLALNFLRYCIRYYALSSGLSFANWANFTARHHFGDMFIPCFLQLPRLDEASVLASGMSCFAFES
jgi:hypothetical protein